MIITNAGGEQTVLASAKADYDKTFQKQIDKGMEKYGVVLKTFNGRDAGQDAFEELVDLSVYLEQLRMEHKAMKEVLFWMYCNSDVQLPTKIVNMIVNTELSPDFVKAKWGLSSNLLESGWRGKV